jgi:Transport protein particle (TRAPP) component.
VLYSIEDMSKSANIAAAGHALWANTPKVNTELFALTYGSLITEILRDYDQDISEVNVQLERIGHSIGVRCVDELLAKSEVNGINIPMCRDLRETAEVIAKIGFRMFLGVN